MPALTQSSHLNRWGLCCSKSLALASLFSENKHGDFFFLFLHFPPLSDRNTFTCKQITRWFRSPASAARARSDVDDTVNKTPSGLKAELQTCAPLPRSEFKSCLFLSVMFIERFTTYLYIMEEMGKSCKLSSDLPKTKQTQDEWILILYHDIHVPITVCYWPTCLCNRLSLKRRVCCLHLPPTPLLPSAITGKWLDGSGERRGCRCLRWLMSSHCKEVLPSHLSEQNRTFLHMERISPPVISPIHRSHAATHSCRRFININKIIGFCQLAKSRPKFYDATTKDDGWIHVVSPPGVLVDLGKNSIKNDS